MPTPTYRKNVALKAVVNNPAEDIVYAVFTEFLMKHKVPPQRFVVYPQLSLKWNPDVEGDKRAEVPDIGVGNFTLPGINPPSNYVLVLKPKAFHRLSFQARNQAKAAIKNGYPIAQNGNMVQWILLIGPYWTPVMFGPFTDTQLTVRALKPTPSADWKETVKENRRFKGPAPALQELFLLSDDTSAHRLEQIIASTDGPLINAMM
ncbi:hypothetical protein JOM56_008934 [Amanita muscaria]